MEAFNDMELQDSDNFFEKGFVSSIFGIRLLHFFENEFNLEVSDDDIQLENFSSVDNMIRLLYRLRGDLTSA